MIMAGFEGASPPTHIVNGLCGGSLGGIILFGNRTVPPAKLRDLTAGLQEAAVKGAAGIPLLIAADQEGGRVNRLSPPLTPFPSAQSLGATGSPELARRMGEALGKELRAVGVNLNMAPVLDLRTNHRNPVIGDRALGSDAALVSKLGSELIAGMQSYSVMATAKHFPGHGDTSFDSHHRLGVVTRSAEAMWEREIRPFKAAVEKGVGAIMTAHVIYGDLDPRAPATLSPRIITGMLRDRLGYNGLVITDDLEMKAIASSHSIGRAAVAAVSAGADMVLVCKDGAAQEEAFMAVVEAVKEDRIEAERIDSSVARIMAAKENYAIPNYNIHIDTVNCPEHEELARRIEKSGRQD
jgi:beta-N-acetylhexosaminidase